MSNSLIQSLELRRLLASAQLNGRVLQVIGGDAADSVVIAFVTGDPTQIEVAFGADSSFFARAAIDRITASLGNGQDTVSLDCDLPADLLLGDGHDRAYNIGSSQVTVAAGLGDDSVESNGKLLFNDSGGRDTVSGSNFDDLINFAERVDGRGGFDIINAGNSGAASIGGGQGNDSINGTDGDDSLDGQDGGDTIIGFGGGDVILGGEGDDALFGDLVQKVATPTASGTGNDRIDSGNGDDTVFGSGGNDSILGGDGADIIYGDAYSTYATTGNDTIRGYGGIDRVFAGPGHDRIYGGRGSDVLDGWTGNDRIVGEDGNDKLDGGAGRDILDGGAGRDAFSGGRGNDLLYARDDADETVNGGSDEDSAQLDSKDDSQEIEIVLE